MSKTSSWSKSFSHQLSKVFLAFFNSHAHSRLFAEDEYRLSTMSLAARSTDLLSLHNMKIVSTIEVLVGSIIPVTYGEQ